MDDQKWAVSRRSGFEGLNGESDRSAIDPLADNHAAHYRRVSLFSPVFSFPKVRKLIVSAGYQNANAVAGTTVTSTTLRPFPGSEIV